MSVTQVRCSHCGHSQIDKSAYGRKVYKCELCGHKYQVFHGPDPKRLRWKPEPMIFPPEQQRLWADSDWAVA